LPKPPYRRQPEDLIHGLQKYVEVDEGARSAYWCGAGASVDSDDTEVTADRMTEEELHKGLEDLAPPEEPPEEEAE
jgi:DNA-directed RNA polymerase subunit omega